MSEFLGRVVLVTGASGALGSAVTGTFRKEGATVVAVARSISPPEAGQERIIPVHADLTTAQGAQAAVAETLRQAKRLDALVHVMGGFAGGQPVNKTAEETWDQMMNLNLRAAFLVARAVLEPMLEARRGRIVAVGSRAGVEPAVGVGAYGVSKAGLNALIQTIAKEVHGKGITANVVLPSTIDTAANRKSMPDADPSRWVKPESIARLILWLCSDAAADTSGALIPVYGKS